MRFEHSLATGASRDALWGLLQDFKRVAACLPGVTDVREITATMFEGSMRVRIGPIGINLSGTVELAQDEGRGQWRMTAHALDRKVGGGARAIVEAAVKEDDPGKAVLNISTDVQLIGRLGELGQPLIKRKADSLLKEFAENLKRALAESA